MRLKFFAVQSGKLIFGIIFAGGEFGKSLKLPHGNPKRIHPTRGTAAFLRGLLITIHTSICPSASVHIHLPAGKNGRHLDPHMALPTGGKAGSLSFAIFVLLITATKQKITEAERRRRARGSKRTHPLWSESGMSIIFSQDQTLNKTCQLDNLLD